MTQDRPEHRVQPSVPAAEALLVIDIGNSRVGVGVWDSDGLHGVRRAAVDSESELRAALSAAWAEVRGAERAVILGSVNPPLTARIDSLVEEISGHRSHRVRDDVPLPLPVDVENEREIGTDRLCSAAAAFERVQGPCAVASFGTAITVDCVSESGRFLGGAILPGLEMSLQALHERTAQLPRVRLSNPRGVFGRNTHDAIVNGVVYGILGALREIVERYATELREWPKLVITGGNAPLIAEMADFVDAVVPDLCLMGVALAYRRASGQA